VTDANSDLGSTERAVECCVMPIRTPSLAPGEQTDDDVTIYIVLDDFG